MLCHLCETFLANLLAKDFTTWRRIKDVTEKWFTFKLGNHMTVVAAAAAGCELCALFNRVRNECIPNYNDLGEKWHAQQASIDVKHPEDGDENGDTWTFQLLILAPETSWIKFEIFKPSAEEGSSYGAESDIDTSDWPQDVSETPSALKSIATAKQWIYACLNLHEQCMRPNATPLPTRVIDVGVSNDKADPRLLISNGRVGQYVTLSHCWGVSYRVTLTKNNLAKFEQAIVLAKLPRTFQDAIKLTRLVGVRYLWIDALCIIQGDQNDWKRESASMCSVFENALFSISAVAAADSHSGMLHERTSTKVKVEINGMQVGVRQKLDSLQEAMTRSRLETRGWCYQERLLPKGILHVAPHQLYWECATCIASETLPVGDVRHPSSLSNKDHATELPNTSTSSIRFSKEWLRLVTAYSARQVTRPSDRLPAIAGLADRAHRELADSIYLQGLWSHDLHAGLLWKRQLVAHGQLIPSRDKYIARSSTSSGERPRRPLARSWSWASTNNAVEFLTTNVYTERLLTKFDAVFLIPQRDDDDEATGTPSMILTMKATVKTGVCRSSSQYSSKPDEVSFKPSGSLLVDDGLGAYLDYVDEVVSKTCYCVRIANWRKPMVKPKKKANDDAERAFYLLLERVQQIPSDKDANEDSFGTFRRIGVGYDLVRKVDKIFANAERRVLRLI